MASDIKDVVTGIQGVPVSPTSPSNGNVLKYVAADSQWEPASVVLDASPTSVTVSYQPGGTEAGTTFTNFNDLITYVTGLGVDEVVILFDATYVSNIYIDPNVYFMPQIVSFRGFFNPYGVLPTIYIGNGSSGNDVSFGNTVSELHLENANFQFQNTSDFFGNFRSIYIRDAQITSTSPQTFGQITSYSGFLGEMRGNVSSISNNNGTYGKIIDAIGGSGNFYVYDGAIVGTNSVNTSKAIGEPALPSPFSSVTVTYQPDGYAAGLTFTNFASLRGYVNLLGVDEVIILLDGSFSLNIINNLFSGTYTPMPKIVWLRGIFNSTYYSTFPTVNIGNGLGNDVAWTGVSELHLQNATFNFQNIYRPFISYISGTGSNLYMQNAQIISTSSQEFYQILSCNNFYGEMHGNTSSISNGSGTYAPIIDTAYTSSANFYVYDNASVGTLATNSLTVTPIGATGIASGDLSGTYPNPTVVAIQSYPISNAAPTDGYALIYSSGTSSWNPAILSPDVVNSTYTPGNPSNWAGSPTTAQEAFDRLAAQVAALGGVPIP